MRLRTFSEIGGNVVFGEIVPKIVAVGAAGALVGVGEVLVGIRALVGLFVVVVVKVIVGIAALIVVRGGEIIFVHLLQRGVVNHFIAHSFRQHGDGQFHEVCHSNLKSRLLQHLFH